MKGQWSEPYPWSPDRDPLAIPYQVKPGDIIRSDIIIRPQFISKWLDLIYPLHEWTMTIGSAFQITPPNMSCEGMVLHSFQIWEGTEEELAKFNKEIEEFFTEDA